MQHFAPIRHPGLPIATRSASCTSCGSRDVSSSCSDFPSRERDAGHLVTPSNAVRLRELDRARFGARPLPDVWIKSRNAHGFRASTYPHIQIQEKSNQVNAEEVTDAEVRYRNIRGSWRGAARR